MSRSSSNEIHRWRLSVRKATAYGLILLGEKAWRVEVSLFRYRWAAKLARLICFIGQRIKTIPKQDDSAVVEIAVEPYVPGYNIITLSSHKDDHLAI